MREQFVSRFRTEIDRSDLIGAAIVAGVFALVGLETTAIAVVLAVLVGVPVVRATVDVAGIDLDLDPGIAGLLLGSVAVAAGAAQLGAGHSYSWFGLALVAIGAWICLDGLDRWRTDDPTAKTDGSTTETDGPAIYSADNDEISTTELALMGEHNRWLIEALRAADRPLTRAEIESRTGLSEAEFEALLETHGESGPIERVGNGYILDEDELGVGAMARSVVRSIWRRLARPLRLLR